MNHTLRERLVRALRWSERYTKTDMVYLTKGMSWIMVSQGVVSSTSLITAVAFANLLPPEVYGQYRYALSMFNILSVLTLIGLNTALMRSAAQNADGTLLRVFRTRLLWGMWGAVAGFAVAAYYLYQGNWSLASSFFVIATFVPLFFSFEVYGSFLRGKKLFRHSTLYAAVPHVASTLSLIAALIFTDNVSLLLLSYFLPYTALRGAFLLRTVRKFAPVPTVDPSAIPYGKHLSVMATFSTIAAEVDKLLLWHLVGPVQVAVYTLAIAPVKQIFAVKSGLEQVVFPKLAENDIEYLKKVMYAKILRLFLLFGAVVIVYIIAAPHLYALVFPQYIESVVFSQVYVLSLLFAPFDLIDTALSAHGKVREQYYMSILTTVGKIALLIALVPFFGIWGVVIGYLALNTLRVAARVYLFANLR